MRNEVCQQPSSPPLPSAIQTLAFWRHPHAYLEWCRRRYGNRFTVNAVGMPPMVMMSDPADIKAIVGAPANVLHPGAGGRAIAPLVGDASFMLAEEDEHLAGGARFSRRFTVALSMSTRRSCGRSRRARLPRGRWTRP